MFLVIFIRHHHAPYTMLKTIKHRSAYICEQQKIKTETSELLRACDHVTLSDVIFAQTQKGKLSSNTTKTTPHGHQCITLKTSLTS